MAGVRRQNTASDTDRDSQTLYGVERLGVIMGPDPGDPREAEGVLNPAGTTAPDGSYYLYPRLVGAGNYSRIGVARLQRDAHGRPCGVDRLGIALEPETAYELVRPGVGGCEDPRVTYVPYRDIYVMAYVALGPVGPHIAFAISRDARTWERRGLVDLCSLDGLFNRYANKDAILLPDPVRAPDGTAALALLHRPMYEGPEGPLPLPNGVVDERFSIWISYCPLTSLGWIDGQDVPAFTQHCLITTPQGQWESYRIGGGTVPLRTPAGWLTFYHGVELLPGGERCYRAGALLLDGDDPRLVRGRSDTPIFGPDTDDERTGVVANVVFPTAVDIRDGGLDLFYGMADSRIGVAHLHAGALAKAWPRFEYQTVDEVARFLYDSSAA